MYMRDVDHHYRVQSGAVHHRDEIERGLRVASAQDKSAGIQSAYAGSHCLDTVLTPVQPHVGAVNMQAGIVFGVGGSAGYQRAAFVCAHLPCACAHIDR